MKLDNKYISAIYASLAEQGLTPEKASLVDQYTDGRTTSVSGMRTDEAVALISKLNEDKQAMRRKVIAMMKELGYTVATMEDWLLVYGKHKKKLNSLRYKELVEVVTQIERMKAKKYNKA